MSIARLRALCEDGPVEDELRKALAKFEPFTLDWSERNKMFHMGKWGPDIKKKLRMP